MKSDDNYDLGWNWHHDLGRIAAVRTLQDRYPQVSIETTAKDHIPQTYDSTCNPIVETWAEGKWDLIIAVAGGYEPCMLKLAKKYPHSVFVAISGTTLGPPNYGIITPPTYHAAYASGYLAGLMSGSRQVCVMLPMPRPYIYLDILAFSYGAQVRGACNDGAPRVSSCGFESGTLAPRGDSLAFAASAINEQPNASNG